MQTFLPYASFSLSASVLDYKRLGKQRVEARQLLDAIDGLKSGWRNHPAAIMWQNYREALIAYGNVMIWEWKRRGYNNSMPIIPVIPGFELPHWFGDSSFHAAHRSNLLRKDASYYRRFRWTEPDNLPYIWPKA